MCLPCAPMNCAKIGMRFLQVLHLKGSELLCIFDIKHVQMFDSSILELSILEGQSPSRSSSTAGTRNTTPQMVGHSASSPNSRRKDLLPWARTSGKTHCILYIVKYSSYPPSFPLLANGHLMGSYGGFGGKQILVNPFSSGFPRSCVLKTKSEQIPGTSQYR